MRLLKKNRNLELNFTVTAEFNYRRDKLWTPVIHLNGKSIWAGAGVKSEKEASEVAKAVVVNTISRLFDNTDGHRRI